MKMPKNFEELYEHYQSIVELEFTEEQQNKMKKEPNIRPKMVELFFQLKQHIEEIEAHRDDVEGNLTDLQEHLTSEESDILDEFQNEIKYK